MTNFDLNSTQRQVLLQHTLERLENYYANTSNYPVSPPLDSATIEAAAKQFDFKETPTDLKQVVDMVIGHLEKYAVHTPHPKYFGLFNPRSNFAGILADWITATLNPQMAAWSHSPYAVEVENYLIRSFGKRFGYKAAQTDGVFCAGGAEANLTALLCALNHAFPQFAKDGLWGMGKRPVIYCSVEAHHSVDKAAKTVGLGYASVRHIPVNGAFKIDVAQLKQTIDADKQTGHYPLMLVGTAGTTGLGVFDDLNALSQIAASNNMWFHVDAAYGGGAILHPDLKSLFKGIEQSQSITFDAHKWLSVPMGASLFITSQPEILSKTFRITTEYMPKEKEATGRPIIDPFTHSIQWSRRFIGLKLYLSLCFFGWKGYEEVIVHQTEMGDYFRKKLTTNGWTVKNETPLPVICFTDIRFESNANFAKIISQNIIHSGKSWLSVYPVGDLSTLRVCITNYQTNRQHIDALVVELNRERTSFRTSLNG